MISKKYVVYELNSILGNDDFKALKRVKFKDKKNGFKSEDDAIQALLDEERGYNEFTIVTEVILIL